MLDSLENIPHELQITYLKQILFITALFLSIVVMPERPLAQDKATLEEDINGFDEVLWW